MIPSTSIPKRVGSIYNRRPTSEWSPKEIKAYKQLVKAGCFDSLDDLALIERYYKSERRKGDKGIHRRDLQTFLNNYQSELDRARAWKARLPRKSVQHENGEKPLSEEEWTPIAGLIKKGLEDFRALMK